MFFLCIFIVKKKFMDKLKSLYMQVAEPKNFKQCEKLLKNTILYRHILKINSKQIC
jgi:hypothetical protein